MTSALSLSLLGVLVVAALSLANPVDRTQGVALTTVQPLEDIMEDEFVMKQQHDADEITPDHDEAMPIAWDDHFENIDRILVDSEEIDNEEVIEETHSESWHGVVKRDVEEEEEEDVVVEEDEGEENAEEGSEDDVEHEVEKREVSDGLLEWYRAAIETKST